MYIKILFPIAALLTYHFSKLNCNILSCFSYFTICTKKYVVIDCGKHWYKHLKKTELRDKIRISNATLAKLGKNEPVNLKIIEAICRELDCDIEDVIESNR